MKNPFKSKYYFRIIDRIADKENEKEDVSEWLKTHKKGTMYWPYYQFKVTRLAEEIYLLRNLL